MVLLIISIIHLNIEYGNNLWGKVITVEIKKTIKKL